MTQLLGKVFARVEKLPAVEQNAVAKWLLNELSFEKRWNKAFVGSAGVLEKLAEEALKEHKQKETWPLDPDTL